MLHSAQLLEVGGGGWGREAGLICDNTYDIWIWPEDLLTLDVKYGLKDYQHMINNMAFRPTVINP